MELDVVRLVEVMKSKGFKSFFCFETITVTSNNGEREEMGITITFEPEINLYNIIKHPKFIFLKSKEHGWKYRLVKTDYIPCKLPSYIVRNVELFPVLPTWFVMEQKQKMYGKIRKKKDKKQSKFSIFH